MPQNCCVPFCHKKVYCENGNKVAYFKFPEDKAMVNAWIWATRRDVGRDFHITENNSCSTVITKQPLLERENLIMTTFRLYFYGRKARPRRESRLISVKPAECPNRPKKKGKKELIYIFSQA